MLFSIRSLVKEFIKRAAFFNQISERERSSTVFESILLGQSTVCERAWYDSVLHSKKGNREEGVVATQRKGATQQKLKSILLEYGKVLFVNVHGTTQYCTVKRRGSLLLPTEKAR